MHAVSLKDITTKRKLLARAGRFVSHEDYWPIGFRGGDANRGGNGEDLFGSLVIEPGSRKHFERSQSLHALLREMPWTRWKRERNQAQSFGRAQSH